MSTTQHRPHTVETTRLIVPNTNAIMFGDPPAALVTLTTKLATAGGQDASPVYAMYSVSGNVVDTPNGGVDVAAPLTVGAWTSSDINTTDTLAIAATTATITYSGTNTIIAKIEAVIQDASGTPSDEFIFACAVGGVAVPGTTVTQTLDATEGSVSNVYITCLARLAEGAILTITAANHTGGVNVLTVADCQITVQKVADYIVV